MRVFVFVLFFASAPVLETQAAAGLVISLKDEAAVVADKALLQDVADLQGPDPQQLETLARIAVGFTPAFGETTVLNRHQILERIEPVVGRLPVSVFTGASAVQIRLRGRQVNADEIASILKSHILETTSWKESEIFIRSIGGLMGVELPPTEGALQIGSAAGLTGHRKILAPIEILHAGKSLRSFWITAEIEILAEVLTAAKRISLGKIITVEDLAPKQVAITNLRALYIRNPAEILGKAARRNISSGDPLTREDFTDPLLVKRGEIIRLRLQREGIALTSLVKAEQDGKLGQWIRVRNIDFSALLEAQVTGRAEVKMQ
jgi:flagella basal body P-ring formation protein FlgA